MPERDYAFAVGRIRVLETRLLDMGRLARMAEAASVADALAQLSETEYAPLAAKGLGGAELAASELARVRDLVLHLAPEAPALQYLLRRWDLLNLKSLVRQEVFGAKPVLNALGCFSPAEIASWFETGRPELPEQFARALQAGRAACREGADPQLLDAAIDRLYYGEGASYWETESMMQKYWPARIDLINLRVLVRGKHLGCETTRLRMLILPGGVIKEDSFAAALETAWEETAAWWGRGAYAAAVPASTLRDLGALERASENLLLALAKPAKAAPFGIDPVLGYYLAKEHETRLVNLILTAKAVEVPAKSIKERLRDVYA